MLDDFFVRALVAGVGVAVVAGPLGCFIVWRRLAYFGDTLAHAALLGVALALLLDSNITVMVFAVAVLIAAGLLALRRRVSLSADSLLGLLSHSALALGLMALAFLSWVRVDLMGFLFGDVLASSVADIWVIYGGGAAALCVLTVIWRPLFAATVNRELAEAEGLNPARAEIVFIVLVAAVITMAMKIVGVLLITALLIIPAAAARRFAAGPEQMAVLAAAIGAGSVVAGLFGSLEWDTPSGPSIVTAALVSFIAGISPLFRLFARGGAAPRVDRG